MYKFWNIKQETDKILKKLEGYIQVHKDTVLPEPAFNRFTNTLAELFNTTAATIALSCLSMRESPFTRELLRRTIWRFCANKDRLAQNNPVLFYPKFSFTSPEEIYFESIKVNGNVYEVLVRVLTGHFAQGTISCKFTRLGVDQALRRCGYCGSRYIIGRREECLPGLFAYASLISSFENPRVFEEVLPNDDICAFNRKHIIGFRSQRVACPHGRHGRCKECPLTVKDCLASYKEVKYDD